MVPLSNNSNYNPLKVVVKNTTPDSKAKPADIRNTYNKFQSSYSNPQQVIAAIAIDVFGINYNMPVTKADTTKASNTFNKEDKKNIESSFYKFQQLKKQMSFLQKGEWINNNVADYKLDLSNSPDEEVIAFSKKVNNNEVLVVFNTSVCEAKEKCIALQTFTGKSSKMQSLYGYDAGGFFPVMQSEIEENKIPYIKLYLKPLHFVILKNS